MQMSHVNWLACGDGSTNFYHKMIATRRSINNIHFLLHPQGHRTESQREIQEHCVEFFSQLLGEQEEVPRFEEEDLSLYLTYRCSVEERTALDLMFTDEEIKNTFLSLSRNKTSGPDGFSSEFFNSCWSVVGGEVTAAVAEFFRTCTLLKQWNATTLVLIPKVPNAETMTDFRPISCLNTVYKVIAKLLTNRLVKVISKMISPS